jgi:hypothetical protein
MLKEGHLPLIEVLAQDADEPANEAEERWRELRRREGWQVSSTR